jgi:urease accessory protein
MNLPFGGLLATLLAPSHLMALIAVGLLIGQQRTGVVSIAAFAAGIAVGLAGIALAAGETAALDVLLVATASTGGLVALARALPVALAAALAIVVGVALGLDSPPEAISLAAGIALLVTTGVGAVAILLLVVLAARHLTRWWQQLAIRIVGSWIAASAILGLALRFARGLVF